MDKIEKFLKKLNKKQRSKFLKIFRDILGLSLKNYDIKPLKELKGIYRLRKNNIRIVFTKGKTKGFIIDIAYRKDAYKK